jgi:hypothetical protein
MTLPSWVPDWSMKLGIHLCYTGEFTNRSFSASLQHEARLGEFSTEVGGSVRLMHVSGATFDSVSAVLEDQWPEDIDFENAWPFFQAARDFVRAEATAYEDVEDVVWRVLSMDLSTSVDLDDRRSHEQTRLAFYDLEAQLQREPDLESRRMSTATMEYFCQLHEAAI